MTQHLLDWRNGDRAALERLTPFVYDELHRLARAYMRRERAGHTLQATALINEAYLRLIDQPVTWQNRAHFLGVAARLMRQILVDHARTQAGSLKPADDGRRTAAGKLAGVLDQGDHADARHAPLDLGDEEHATVAGQRSSRSRDERGSGSSAPPRKPGRQR